MPPPEAELLFLVDVDNTLLDNDRIQSDLREHLLSDCGAECRDRDAAILPRQDQHAPAAAVTAVTAVSPARDRWVKHIAELLTHDAHTLANRNPP